MVSLTLAEIAGICEGRLENADGRITATGVAIDSRTVRSGDLFVALPGERTDGHRFATDAIARGAVAVLARVGTGVGDVPAIRVADPASSLSSIASAVRSRSGARVVAITGSSGKTSTKQMTAAACAKRYRTVSSAASYNNELGVPLTICALDADSEVLVAEVGSRGPGHIAMLMPLLRPDVSVVTNVGQAHYEMFGSLEATASAKGEIVEALPDDGIAVLNADDPRVVAMKDRTRAATVLFGTAPDATVRAENVELDQQARAHFKVVTPSGQASVTLRMPGEHMVSNALAAIAVASSLGVGIDDAAQAVGQVESLTWRMQVARTPAGATLINDSYNANPASAAAALKALVALGQGRRTWAVLGEMAELGPISAAEHDRLGRLCVRLGVGRLVAVGDATRPMREAAVLEGMLPEEATWVVDAGAATALLVAEIEEGDVILVKGSRVAGLERVAAALVGDQA